METKPRLHFSLSAPAAMTLKRRPEQRAQPSQQCSKDKGAFIIRFNQWPRLKLYGCVKNRIFLHNSPSLVSLKLSR